VQRLFRCGNGPKELWLVPDAKHNRCRECEPEAYAARLLDFIDRYAPRRPVIVPAPDLTPLAETRGELQGDYAVELEAPKLAGQVATPLG
jgi:hypothetical protein